MADQLLTGTTLVENTSRSIGDIPVGGIIEWDDTYTNLPEGFKECDGSVVADPLSSYNGATLPNYNTQYWSCEGSNFHGIAPDASNVDYNIANGVCTQNTNAEELMGPVFLPNGAIVTGFIVYSNVSTDAASLRRVTISSAAVADMSSEQTFNSEDTSISNATIDNSLYGYYIVTTSLANTNQIYGARIKYTPRQKFIIRIR